MTRTILIGYFPWKNHFPSSHYSTIKHGFSYSTKCLPVRAFTIRGPLWSSSIFTSYQPWKKKNESYLHQTILGPLPKTFFYGDFFKGWHQWQPTLINKWSHHWNQYISLGFFIPRDKATRSLSNSFFRKQQCLMREDTLIPILIPRSPLCWAFYPSNKVKWPYKLKVT